MKTPTNAIIQGDALEKLKELPSESINCCVTSPPYYFLRDYGVAGQLGLEPTCQEYINKLCNIFDEVKRVLRKDGTCWVNISDSYSGSMGKKNGWTDNKLGFEKQEAIDAGVCLTKKNKIKYSLPQKCLYDVPFRFVIEMVNRGWTHRQTIIWHKPNVLPSPCKDRFTIDFEYVFLFTKNKHYFFEQQTEPLQKSSLERMNRKWRGSKHEKLGIHNNLQQEIGAEERMNAERWCPEQGRNMRCVWKISTKGFKEAHFATFPLALIEPMLKAGCPEFVCKKCGQPRKKVYEKGELISSGPNKMAIKPRGFAQNDLIIQDLPKDPYGGMPKRDKKFGGLSDCSCNAGFEPGIVLDPFLGSATTALVALKQNKHFIGIELKTSYIEIAKKRLKPYLEQTKIGEQVTENNGTN